MGVVFFFFLVNRTLFLAAVCFGIYSVRCSLVSRFCWGFCPVVVSGPCWSRLRVSFRFVRFCLCFFAVVLFFLFVRLSIGLCFFLRCLFVSVFCCLEDALLSVMSLFDKRLALVDCRV